MIADFNGYAVTFCTNYLLLIHFSGYYGVGVVCASAYFLL